MRCGLIIVPVILGGPSYTTHLQVVIMSVCEHICDPHYVPTTLDGYRVRLNEIQGSPCAEGPSAVALLG